MKFPRQLGRRSLLRGLAGASMALPLSHALVEGVGHANTGEQPLRFFLMFTGNGQLPSHWLPSGGETDFALSPVLQPLEAHRDKLLLMHGLSGATGHSGGMSETTTGWAATNGSGIAEHGPSIDQLFAKRWSASSALPSLELGVFPANDLIDQISYSETGMSLPAIGSPLGAFQRLFDLTNLDPGEAAKARERDVSVLDHLGGEIESLRAKIGTQERRLLDEHLTLVSDLESQLGLPYVPLDCELPAAPTGLGLVDTFQSQLRNAVTAFRCGVTRVVSLRAGGWGGIEEGKYDEIGVATGHHSAAHTGPASDLLAINRFHAQQLAHLLDELDAVPEGDGTLLDNTVVLWVNELGLGELNHHSRTDVHVTMAGGANAGLRNGAFVDLGGIDYQHFLFSLTQLMGLDDVTSFGRAGSQRIDAMFA